MTHRIEIPKQSEAEVQRGTLKMCRSLLGKDNVERRNTGGMYDPRGQFVRYGRKGNSDILCQTPGTWGAASGKTVVIECKAGGFKPYRPVKPPKPGEAPKPKSKDRVRWETQVKRMRQCNANGGYGFWVNEKNAVVDVLLKIKAGWRVDLDDGDYVVMIPPEAK